MAAAPVRWPRYRQETATSYYRSVDPVRHSINVSEPAGMLAADIFHYGLRPYEHIRQLAMDVGPPVRGNCGQLYCPGHGRSLHHLEIDIFSLLKMKVKSKFHLIVAIRCRQGMLEGLAQLAITCSVHLKLRAAGARITTVGWHAGTKKSYDISNIIARASDTSPNKNWMKYWKIKIQQEHEKKRRQWLRREKERLRTSNDPEFGGLSSSSSHEDRDAEDDDRDAE